MSGILDSKTRIIDAMLTTEGRRQLGDGKFKVEYVTFGDSDISYVADSSNGHEDPTTKIYLEANSLPQDQIIFEANDDGKLNPLRTQNYYIKTPGINVSSSYSIASIVNGKMLVTERFHGRRVKVSNITSNKYDLDLGFNYSDASGKVGSILIDPNLESGKTIISAPVGGPYVGYIGTAFGLNENKFSQLISEAVNSLSTSGGPQCITNYQNNVVFFDALSSNATDKLQLTYSGTLSSPIQLEESAIGGRILTDEVENSIFSSQVPGILSSSFDNFVDLGIISTVDRLDLDDKFFVDKNELFFNVERIDIKKTKSSIEAPPQLNSIDSIFNDDKLSHLENFMYLPPLLKGTLPQYRAEISKKSPDKNVINSFLLGDYPSWGDNEKKLDLEKIHSQLAEFESRDVVITETSLQNNVIGQIFEVANNTVTKLDIVDYGSIRSNINDDPLGENRRVLFVGKVYIDNRGTTCFVNIFTLIMSKVRREEL